MNLKDAVIIVTGGGTGVGAACARVLAKRGARVVINYNKSQAGALEAAKQCKQLGGDAITTQGNVVLDDDCKKIASEAMERWGRIDGLVNNAGITRFAAPRDLAALSSEDFIDLYSTNVVGSYQMIRACAEHLKTSRGSVVNISSIAGVKAIGSSTAYIASKAALNAMTVALARALAPEIRINAVCPGLVDTEWHSKRFSENEYKSFLENYENTVPLRSAATPEDIAECVIWLLSSARLVTGETILVDAGLHLGKSM
ncbi:MAG TPA: oxidoreductase [Betaproteobacteria bacterium]|jgi:3-oxoacyl-[acyl-carrier protein] reductase|nr:oxidoreductase [Betaproteobacteria bacterium]